jgi:hypothetical protein
VGNIVTGDDMQTQVFVAYSHMFLMCKKATLFCYPTILENSFNGDAVSVLAFLLVPCRYEKAFSGES